MSAPSYWVTGGGHARVMTYAQCRHFEFAFDGSIDAPELMPAGSVESLTTLNWKGAPVRAPSLTQRDATT